MTPASSRQLNRRAWRRTLWISVVALAAYVGIRHLPLASGSLHYTDFHAGGKTFLEFCEPGSPQFAPVDKVRSPVEMKVETSRPPVQGKPVEATVTLTSSSGKPVTFADLLVVHAERLHLLLVDASLNDYHHVHPVPTDEPGVYSFAFYPSSYGPYRVFGDFTPRATGRALYSGAVIEVRPAEDGEGVGEKRPAAEPLVWSESWVGDCKFSIAASRDPIRTNESTELSLVVQRPEGAPVDLEDIMDAKAHLVAFDQACSGFAHLHPTDALPAEVDGGGQELRFTLNLSDPGYYRLWAQVKLDGREVFAPFGFEVVP